jgi:hypothetical protein
MYDNAILSFLINPFLPEMRLKGQGIVRTYNKKGKYYEFMKSFTARFQ